MLNKSSLTANEEFKFINYLDTGNLWKNRIVNLVLLEKNFPSRAKRKVTNNTILYSTVRPNQEHFGIIENEKINTQNLIVSTGFITIDVFNKNINAKYLYYKLTQKSITQYLQAIAENSVSAYPSINPKDIGNIKFEFPSLPTQQKIAAVLSALDDKIELNNKINAELEQMAKTLYDYWFVQFDFPDAEGRPYKSSGGKMVYNETLKREIPEGWEVRRFSKWIKETKAGDWGKDTREGNYTERVFCIRGADINGLNGKGGVYAPERFILKNNMIKTLKPNDFIIEISGGSPTQSTARIALLTDQTFERFDTEIVCSNFCKAVSIKDHKYIFNFQQEWQRLYDAGVFFGFEGKTSGIKNFLFDSFINSYSIVYPPIKVVAQYYNFAQALEVKKQTNLQQNQQLTALRDWLLPMLMNGQVQVQTQGVAEREYQVRMPGMAMVAEAKTTYQTTKTELAAKQARRKALAVFITNQSLSDRTFGKTKFEKLLHLVEHHIVKEDCDQKYYIHAAGPYDGYFTKSFWLETTAAKWYKFEERGQLQLIKAAEDHSESLREAEHLSATLKASISDFIQLFQTSNYAYAEIISTLYAVWNNRLIRNEIVEDALLKQDFLQWDTSKAQYARQLDAALEWMRQHGIIPDGWGKEIVRSKSKQ